MFQTMTDVAGNPEEERKADFYYQPWAQEAVCRYFYGKVRVDVNLFFTTRDKDYCSIFKCLFFCYLHIICNQIVLRERLGTH